MNVFNLALVHVSMDISVLAKHLMLESGDSTSCDNENGPSLHRFGVIVYCSARYALVLTCTRAFYHHYQGENVSTKQLVQYYQS